MQNRSVVVVLLSSLGLIACGGAAKEPETGGRDPWADFKGTYSTPGASSEAKAEKAEKAAVTKKESKPKAEPTVAADEGASKRASKGTINGESLSSVSVDALTDFSKSALKTKFVSNSVVTGARYELVQVQLKGATVQITRPSATPVAKGPSISSPKAKNADLSKNDAGWYDEEADVLVTVSAAGKKAAAQKALATIVKH